MFNELKADAGPALVFELAHGLKGLGDYRSLYVNNTAPSILSTGQWSSCAEEIGKSRMEVPGRALDDKAQCKWSQQLSRQELQNFNARRMRSSSV